jgi:hypothetical protein
MLVGGGAAVLLSTFALQSYVSNNNKESHQFHRRLKSLCYISDDDGFFGQILLLDGTGSVCVNKKNYSNFIYNEFRCPLSPIFPANDRYCCGSFQEQFCCSFWARYFFLFCSVLFFLRRWSSFCSSSSLHSLFFRLVAIYDSSEYTRPAQLRQTVVVYRQNFFFFSPLLLTFLLVPDVQCISTI